MCINSNDMVKFLNNSDDEPKTYFFDNTKENNIFGSEENGDLIVISVSYDSIIPIDLSNCKYI